MVAENNKDCLWRGKQSTIFSTSFLNPRSSKWSASSSTSIRKPINLRDIPDLFSIWSSNLPGVATSICKNWYMEYKIYYFPTLIDDFITESVTSLFFLCFFSSVSPIKKTPTQGQKPHNRKQIILYILQNLAWIWFKAFLVNFKTYASNKSLHPNVILIFQQNFCYSGNLTSKFSCRTENKNIYWGDPLRCIATHSFQNCFNSRKLFVLKIIDRKNIQDRK